MLIPGLAVGLGIAAEAAVETVEVVAVETAVEPVPAVPGTAVAVVAAAVLGTAVELAGPHGPDVRPHRLRLEQKHFNIYKSIYPPHSIYQQI